MHQIRFRLWLRPRPRWGSLQRSPRSPSCIKGALLLRGRERKERQRKGERKRMGREKGRGREGVAKGPAHARAGSEGGLLLKEGERKERREGEGRKGMGFVPLTDSSGSAPAEKLEWLG